MTRLLTAGMLLFCAVFSGPYGQDIIVIKIKVELANVRSQPDINAPIIKQLKSGTLLEVSQKLGNWFEISVPDDRGKPVFGYILQSDLVYSVQIPILSAVSSGTEDIKKNLKALDYGLVLGTGASLPLGGISLFIEGRYHPGMAELEETPGEYETLITGEERFLSKSRLMLFMLGLKF